MKNVFLVFVILALPLGSFAATFEGHCRNREPELFADGKSCKGPVPEIIETALKRLGHGVSWSEIPWKRTIESAKDGSVDLIPRHSMNEEREAFLHAVPYGYKERKIFYMISPKIDIEINTLGDLAPHIVGVLRGSYYSDNFAKAKNLKKKPLNNNDQIIKMLASGRIDVAPTSSAHEVDKFRALPGIKEAAYSDTFLNSRNIGIPKKSSMAKYFASFKDEVNKMVDSGEIDKIFAKYGVKPPAQKK